jgi:hypothetical protein
MNETDGHATAEREIIIDELLVDGGAPPEVIKPS